ncbi:hypothetical protein [Aquimarina algiphila]|uniref:hypothetical protein n=1 Tax=Aquimarina algiphila TaxID=2047982 RepID=UPI00232F9916|nr:hypothetical protein [Aquimarina algiphila]
MSNIEQAAHYAVLIQSKLTELFEDDADITIDINELAEDDEKATAFIHALANLVPANIYMGLTDNSVNSIDFNHIANKLCFQYSKEK